MTDEDNESEILHTDFTQAFEELYSHQLTIPRLDINIRNNFVDSKLG
ncbi:hypothetical protein Riv7116_2781 [Rivularia sp. PCC 7116]|nr:hypothetical protein [Rivularia sp. PCC 7116]AFY55280.1 hypothetical protein Riv7116_2781 [Rivularia sp. PCC 7116]